MPINNIKAIGDDQAWKAEVERTISSLTSQIAALKSQLNAKV